MSDHGIVTIELNIDDDLPVHDPDCKCNSKDIK